MGSILRMRVLAGVVILVALVATGCKLVTTPQATVSMHVGVEIQRYLEGNSHISIRFSDSANNTIEFVSGETVACNGQFLRYESGFYIGDVPRQASGGSYSITYTPASATATGTPTNSAPATFKVGVVDGEIAFSQPTNGAAVAIPSTSPLTITYRGSSIRDTTVYATATDSRYHVTAVLPQADSGTLTMPADNFADFQGGPGTLTLARLTKESVGGTSFSGVDVQFKNLTVERIQWQ